MKKLLSIILILALLFNVSIVVYAANVPAPHSTEVTLRGTVDVLYNDEEVVLKDVNGNTVLPVFFNGSHYLPIRALCELVGLNVEWDANTKTVKLTSGGSANRGIGNVDAADTKANATVATNFTVTLDGKVQTFIDGSGNTVYPVVYNGTTYLPLRSVAGLVGLNVGWIGGTKTILLADDMHAQQKGIEELVLNRKAPEVVGVEGVEPYSDFCYDFNNVVKADLTGNLPLAQSLTISNRTKFEKAPLGYDQHALIEWGKSPGLNVDILHKYGFTGEGAVIAYIDQPFVTHSEYDSVNVHYTNNSTHKESMHGPAVLSLLAGENIGVAPKAEIYYYGHASWEMDQATHAECLYQIIEQNKTLPEDKKITMVGFSDNIDPNEKNAAALEKAVKACEDAGIMVWFCKDYAPLSFLPLCNKNDYTNLIEGEFGFDDYLVAIPTGGRTYAATEGGQQYYYCGAGGLSWAMPYALGLYAIAIEINPNLTQDDLKDLIVDTAYVHNEVRIVNPVGFISAVLTQAGRVAEAQAMQGAIDARQEYIYAIMDESSMSKTDIDAVEAYLGTLTGVKTFKVDAGAYADAEAIYEAIQKDSAYRGGKVRGIQIFGTSDAVQPFEVDFKVQMSSGVDEAGSFYTDLFYGNFDNEAEIIANGYNVMDHFAEGWNVELAPDWPVVRLPLSKGEYTAFFEKYNEFAAETGLTQLEIVNFSNPIFKQKEHTDDMGFFLNRMKNEFGMLNVPYRLYGNKVGQYPVTTPVIGEFTAENIALENSKGTYEFIINSHGQRNNVDKAYFENNEEIRESLFNSSNINSVFSENPYYLDLWTCNNGDYMKDNLTTVALNGNAVGVFSATAIISNNGVNCYETLEQMKKSNLYYFYYTYLKSLNEGKSRSVAFNTAQKEYAKEVVADSANGIRSGEGNYQFNLINVLSYHNFGVLEPDFTVTKSGKAVTPGQAPQEVIDKVNGNNNNNGGNANIIGDNYILRNELKSGSFDVHKVELKDLGNGKTRITYEITAKAGLTCSIFNPPDGDLFMINKGTTTGARQTITCDVQTAHIEKINEITAKFYSTDDDKAYIFIKMQ